MIPYLVLKGVLKIGNPVAMIRGVLDLFLAQPFGGRSLLQRCALVYYPYSDHSSNLADRLFTGSLAEEVKAIHEDIVAVSSKVDDDAFCEKVRNFVYAPSDVRTLLRGDAAAERQHLWTVVLRASEAPVLTRAQMQRVAKASRAHAAYQRHRESLADSDEDDGPQDEDAWLYEDLTVLAKLYARLKEKEEMIALLFEVR